MKTPLTVATLAVLALVALPATAAERACRPSLSNMYHCPDNAPSAPKPKADRASDRECHPSLSNLWTCPDNSKPRRKSVSTSRDCRPSLSNGYKCPKSSEGGADKQKVERPAKNTVSTERGCRPSLSNGYKCPGSTASPTEANQYTSEAQAKAHCRGDTVVWANTRSHIYHFSGTHNYGTTIAGGYMCEGDAESAGMRAAKNETHP